MQVISNRLYKTASVCDKGTLKQLANVIHRTHVPTKVKNDYNAVIDFFSVTLDAHITAAAMQFFGMKETEAILTKHAFQGDLQKASAEYKEKYLTDRVRAIIAEFILPHVQSISTPAPNDQVPRNAQPNVSSTTRQHMPPESNAVADTQTQQRQ